MTYRPDRGPRQGPQWVPGLRVKTRQAGSDISPPLVTHGSGMYRANNVPLYSGDLNGFLFRGLVWLAFEPM